MRAFSKSTELWSLPLFAESFMMGVGERRQEGQENKPREGEEVFEWNK